jgi:hypothetical protein
VLWRIFGPRREEVTGGWRKLHKEELNNLYASQNKSRWMKCAGHITHGEMRNAFNILDGKPEG